MGFYVGAYLKYQSFKDEIKGNYVDSNTDNNRIQLDAKIKSSLVGFQLGYKLRVKQRFFIDFIIAGPGLSFNTFELAEKIPIPDEFYDDFSNAVSNYAILEFLNTDFRLDANKKSDKVILPAFRYGIKLGYSF